MTTRERNGFAEILERVCRQLLGPPTPADGCSLSSLQDAETRFGFQIPKPLREYYLQFGENQILCHAQDLLFKPEMLEVEERHLIFWQENQRVYLAGIRLDVLHQADPPVEQEGTEEGAIWYPECRRLTDFLLRTVCWQATWGLPSQASAEGLPLEAFERIAARFPLVAPREPYEHEMICYAEEGLVICTCPKNTTLYVGARGDELLEQFEQAFSIRLSWL